MVDLQLSVCKLLSQFTPYLWKLWGCWGSPRAVVQLTPSSSRWALAWTNRSSGLIGNARINYQRTGEILWNLWVEAHTNRTQMQIVWPALGLQTICAVLSTSVLGCGRLCTNTTGKAPRTYCLLTEYVLQRERININKHFWLSPNLCYEIIL